MAYILPEDVRFFLMDRNPIAPQHKIRYSNHMDKYAANYFNALTQAIKGARSSLKKVDPLSFTNSLTHMAPAGAIGGGTVGGVASAIKEFDKLREGDTADYWSKVLGGTLKGGVTGAGLSMLPSLAVKAVSIPRGTSKALTAFGTEDRAVKDMIIKYLNKVKIQAPPASKP